MDTGTHEGNRVEGTVLRETWVPRIAVNFMYNYTNQYPRDYSDPVDVRTDA